MSEDLPEEMTDAIAERLADEVTDRVLREHPKASPEFRRKLCRLYLKQATGSVSNEVSNATLAGFLEVDPRRLSEESKTALLKLRRAWLARHAD